MDFTRGVILDFETTGHLPEQDSIFQMAAIALDLRSGCHLDHFASHLHQEWTTVPALVRKLTRIRSEVLIHAPLPAEAMREFASFAANAECVIAHNARRCEMPFLRSACQRHGLAVREIQTWDTVDLSIRLWGHEVRHDLDSVLKRLGISTQGFQRHDARDDALLLAEALPRMLSLLRTMDLSTAIPSFLGVLPC
jgi:DNA polymerase III epsilon subunit-like protein